MGTKMTNADTLSSTPVGSSNQTAIPSPQSNSLAAITPLSHESMVGQHARSASVPNVRPFCALPRPESHFQHIESPQPAIAGKICRRPQHEPELNHSAQPNNNLQSMQHHPNNQYHTSMDGHFDQQQSYGNQYNSSGVIHSTLNSQPNAEYNDPNYYNSFYANYDDQIMRPYSASSNSCSSSNSDGDSQMASHHHPMHPNNSHNHQEHQSQQQHCHPIVHPANNQVLQTANASELHTPSGNGGTSAQLDASNLSPEYIDCMDQRASHHSFEVNCFNGIGNVGIHHLSDDLQSNYMPNSHGVGVNNNSNSILLNGNASSGGTVLFNGNNLSGNQNITDSIHYTSVIVDSNSYHISNDQYVH